MQQEYEIILRLVSKSLKPVHTPETVQNLAVAIYCVDQNRFWRSDVIQHYLDKIFKHAVKFNFSNSVPKQLTLAFDPVVFQKLVDVYDCVSTRLAIDALITKLKSLQIRKNLTYETLEPFIVQTMAVCFVHFYSTFQSKQKQTEYIFDHERETGEEHGPLFCQVQTAAEREFEAERGISQKQRKRGRL
ncbi:Hypothetical_protein [Hexamita inflata]|uniref:Hypothetical_protein n=1 Tax=Hexamita inflata TaxID=28002 RepID=A0AA86N942_9EUKA|nr:Hypothetical protein HINF_LOCUS2887 [Hexamita inflata]